MTKKELELENAVLRNAIAYQKESLEIAERTGKDYVAKVGIIEGILSTIEEKMKFAKEYGETLDYRYSAKTIGELESRFLQYGNTVILNDGMVMGMIY